MLLTIADMLNMVKRPPPANERSLSMKKESNLPVQFFLISLVLMLSGCTGSPSASREDVKELLSLQASVLRAQPSKPLPPAAKDRFIKEI